MDKKKLILALIIFSGIFYFYEQSFFYKKNNPKIITQKKAEPLSLAFLGVQGKVTVERNGKTEEVSEGVIIDSSCNIKTFEKSFAVLAYGPSLSSKIKIGSNTNFDLEKIELNYPDQKEGLVLNLVTGELLLRIFNPGKKIVLNIKTKHAMMKVRGTTFFVKTNDMSSLLIVNEGSVELEGDEARSNLFVYAKSGYLINSLEKANAANLNHYKINWDIEAQGPDILLPNNDFSLIIDSAIEQVKKELENMDADLKKIKFRISELERSNDIEFLNLEKDITCLNNRLGNCDLKSEVFTRDILHKRGNLKNILTFGISEGLKVEIEKYKTQLIERVAVMRTESVDVIKDISEMEHKYKLARSKLDQLNSLEGVKKEEVKNVVYKEIVDIIDDNNLKMEFEKIQ